MKKAEFIERYGIEAYEKQLEYKRKWYQENSEKIKESKREWYQENCERVKEKQRERNHKWYHENCEQAKERSRKWRMENSEREKERLRKWRMENSEKARESSRKWAKKNPLNSRANKMLQNYKQSDIEANRGKCTLTSKWIIENIFTSKCIYCGDDNWEHLGCDRKDNSKPHTSDNIVCACGICNAERSDNYTVEEFIQYRKLHPRSIDIPKQPILNEKGAIVKREVYKY